MFQYGADSLAAAPPTIYMPTNYNKEKEIAVSIAREAGKIIVEYFDIDQQVEIKEDKSPVTIADKKVNSLVIERLSEAFPDDGIVGEEESTSEYGMGRKWICDPIDGTAGYIWGTPTAFFSLALVVDGHPVLGVVYDAFLDKMYIGQEGQPSECNGKIIFVSSLTIFEGVVAVTGGVRNLLRSSYCKKLVDDKIKLACFSGAVIKACLLARGKFSGFIEPGVNLHDIAAIHTIVEGAGGKITSMNGGEITYLKPIKGCIISNGINHAELIEYCREG
jgi:fructose-1,6-bisphosphatase/inositol monophosphatase family enzyme